MEAVLCGLIYKVMPGVSGWCDWGLATHSRNKCTIYRRYSNSERSTLSSIQRSSNSCQKEVQYLGHTVSPEGITPGLKRNWRLYRNGWHCEQAQTKELLGPMYPLQALHLQLRWLGKAVDQIHKGETSFSMVPRSRGRLPITEEGTLYCSHPQLQAIRRVNHWQMQRQNRWGIVIGTGQSRAANSLLL